MAIRAKLSILISFRARLSVAHAGIAATAVNAPMISAEVLAEMQQPMALA